MKKKGVDHILLKQIEDRSEQAFKFFFDRYYVPLSAFAYHFVKDEEDSKTIASDVLLTLWESPKSFQNIHSISAYLYKSIKNRCIDYLRHKEPLLESMHYEESVVYFVPEDEILECLIYKELVIKIDAAIEKLPANTKKIFCLSRKEHLSYVQIADRLQISINTVKYHMKNALILLRAELKDYLRLALILIGLS